MRNKAHDDQTFSSLKNLKKTSNKPELFYKSIPLWKVPHLHKKTAHPCIHVYPSREVRDRINSKQPGRLRPHVPSGSIRTKLMSASHNCIVPSTAATTTQDWYWLVKERRQERDWHSGCLHKRTELHGQYKYFIK